MKVEVLDSSGLLSYYVQLSIKNDVFSKLLYSSRLVLRVSFLVAEWNKMSGKCFHATGTLV